MVKGPEGFLFTIFDDISEILNLIFLIRSEASLISSLVLKENFSIFFPSSRKILDVTMNYINGGSFAVTACKKNSPKKSNDAVIEWLLRNENEMSLNTLKPFELFKDRIYAHRTNLRNLIFDLISNGKKIIGYGASTKGNVLLQFCKFSEKELICMAEINQEKIGGCRHSNWE